MFYCITLHPSKLFSFTGIGSLTLRTLIHTFFSIYYSSSQSPQLLQLTFEESHGSGENGPTGLEDPGESVTSA